MLSEDSDNANVAPERQDPEEVLFQLGGTNSPRFTGYASTVVTYVICVHCESYFHWKSSYAYYCPILTAVGVLTKTTW